MGVIIGIVVVMVMVFGGYLLAGGKMGIILKALPFEMMMIGGAATGPIEGTTGAETAPAIAPAEPEPSAATGTIAE